MTIAHEIGGQKPLAEVLRGLQRYIDMTAAASPMQIPGEPVSAPTLRSADASDVRLWRIALRAWRDHRLSEPPGNLNALEAPAWSRWAQNILGYFTGTPPVITLEDLVLAAADRPPATLFQRDLGRLGIRDWTNLCLHGARQAADFDPQVARPIYVTAAWGIIAGLRALHFSRELLTRLADELERAAPEAAGIMKTLAEGAPQSPPGALIVVDDPGFVDASGISARQPCLAVLRPQLTEHSNALTWLRAWDVYVIVYNESQADEPDETET